jgi:hypothetical protein
VAGRLLGGARAACRVQVRVPEHSGCNISKKPHLR